MEKLCRAAKACLMASSSLRVIGELPLSLRQSVLKCQPRRWASFVCLPVPRSSLSELQAARNSAGVNSTP